MTGREVVGSSNPALTNDDHVRIEVAAEIISREDAIAQGLKRYFDGVPCIHGHTAAKIIRKDRDSGACAECRRLASLRWKHEHTDRSRELAARWAAENPEKKRDWQRQNRDRARSANRRHYRRNQAAMLNRARKQRAVRNGCPGNHTPADLRAILKAQNHRCAYCRADLRKVKRHLDHVMPLALGGSNGPENLQYLCAPCNLAKGAKHPVQFAQERGLLL